MEFLSGKPIFDQVKKFISSNDGLLRVAVSYWGKEVLDETGLLQRIKEKPDSVRVICDLASPGCNPDPIEQLMGRGVRVRTLNKFHAKVWICGSTVIIGSPNFSKNGLGYDKKSFLSNNVEAAVLVKDRNFAGIVETWFEEQWHKSDQVDATKITEARSRKNERNEAERKLKEKERKRQYEERKERLDEELQELALLSFKSGNGRKEFFRILLSALKKLHFVQARYVKPQAKPQISFRSNRNSIPGQQTGIRYFVRVASSDGTRVELNIDNKQLTDEQKKAWNKQKFNEIEYEREVIEQKLGETLEWELKPNQFSSGIVAVKKQTIQDEDADLQEILLWIVDKLITFDDTFKQFQDFRG